MQDIKAVIADNIIQLRRSNGMTQAELAEILNYTDKAVSKWERKESLPDITVLKAIADCFGVTVDYLITAEHAEPEIIENDNTDEKKKTSIKNRSFITGMSVLLVWLIAAFAFVFIGLIGGSGPITWLSFVYAVPASMIVWLVLNSIWFNSRRNFLIISLLMWSVLLAVFLSILPAGPKALLIFILGIPGQAIIILWSRIKRRSK